MARIQRIQHLNSPEASSNFKISILDSKVDDLILNVVPWAAVGQLLSLSLLCMATAETVPVGMLQSPPALPNWKFYVQLNFQIVQKYIPIYVWMQLCFCEKQNWNSYGFYSEKFTQLLYSRSHLFSAAS